MVLVLGSSTYWQRLSETLYLGGGWEILNCQLKKIFDNWQVVEKTLPHYYFTDAKHSTTVLILKKLSILIIFSIMGSSLHNIPVRFRFTRSIFHNVPIFVPVRVQTIYLFFCFHIKIGIEKIFTRDGNRNEFFFCFSFRACHVSVSGPGFGFKLVLVSVSLKTLFSGFGPFWFQVDFFLLLFFLMCYF